jgi:hypothetical protein
LGEELGEEDVAAIIPGGEGFVDFVAGVCQLALFFG